MLLHDQSDLGPHCFLYLSIVMFFLFDLILYVLQQYFSYKGTGLPGLNHKKVLS